MIANLYWEYELGLGIQMGEANFYFDNGDLGIWLLNQRRLR